jgi:FtsZ-interacting cell division protein YlmF
MVDDIKDAPQEKPAISTTGRTTTPTAGNKLKDVNIFPALTDRRGMPMSARQAPTRLGTQISVFCPVTFEEALDIVECLRGRAATTISLENMKKLDASRLVDFVAGASAALDGDFHKLSEQVYLFCPSNIKITAPGKQEASAAGSSLGGIISNPLGLNGELDFLYPSASATLGKAGLNSPFGATWPTTLQ